MEIRQGPPSRTFMGAVIRARYAKGWSQQRLADEVGHSRVWVEKQERGHIYLRFDDARALADVLDIDMAHPDESWR